MLSFVSSFFFFLIFNCLRLHFDRISPLRHNKTGMVIIYKPFSICAKLVTYTSAREQSTRTNKTEHLSESKLGKKVCRLKCFSVYLSVFLIHSFSCFTIIIYYTCCTWQSVCNKVIDSRTSIRWRNHRLRCYGRCIPYHHLVWYMYDVRNNMTPINSKLIPFLLMHFPWFCARYACSLIK